MELTFTHESDWWLGWTAPEPRYMARASHALVHGGDVWLVDPVDGEGLRDRLAALGEVRGVLQLLDRHPRDGAALAGHFAVPLVETPFDGLPGTPFEVVGLTRRGRWRETALWWPERAALVVPEALGTVGYYRAPGRPVGVHPLLRLTPPSPLTGIPADHLLVGHGPPLTGPRVAAQIDRAVRSSRREIPRWLLGLPGARRRTV